MELTGKSRHRPHGLRLDVGALGFGGLSRIGIQARPPWNRTGRRRKICEPNSSVILKLEAPAFPLRNGKDVAELGADRVRIGDQGEQVVASDNALSVAPDLASNPDQ